MIPEQLVRYRSQAGSELRDSDPIPIVYLSLALARDHLSLLKMLWIYRHFLKR